MHRIFWRSRVPIHAHAEVFWLRRPFMQSNSACVCLPVNVFAARQFLVSNAPMVGRTHLSTWISSETKQRFAIAAAGQSLSESALLRRLIELMLASAPSNDLAEPVAPSGLRIHEPFFLAWLLGLTGRANPRAGRRAGRGLDGPKGNEPNPAGRC